MCKTYYPTAYVIKVLGLPDDANAQRSALSSPGPDQMRTVVTYAGTTELQVVQDFHYYYCALLRVSLLLPCLIAPPSVPPLPV